MAGLNFPVLAIRQQMCSALDILVHLGRLTGGRRKIMSIAEVTGIEGDMILLQDIFRFRQVGVSADGHAYGNAEACGIRPQMLERLEEEGIHLPKDFFQRRMLASTTSNGKGSHRDQ